MCDDKDRMVAPSFTGSVATLATIDGEEAGSAPSAPSTHVLRQGLDSDMEHPSVGLTHLEIDDAEVAAGDEDEAVKRRHSRVRLLLLLLLLVSVAIVVRWTGVFKRIDREYVRKMILEAGPWGWAAYAGIFAVGEVLHMPGIIFVAAAVYAYGRFWGGVLAYMGSMTSVSVGFLIARMLGGGATLESIGLPACFMKCFESLATAPIRTVALLRIAMYLAPNLNMALGITRINFFQYFLGSALGLIPMTMLITSFLEQVLSTGYL